ncbi:uncharacterized protein EV422DRAFT_571416 [Fimicolochytrium jonesii]|uniref:uncharacterized protein n=1 Tax=Fimicolochytrium jonesii TaxID=1396493 RepID=UPI0022FEED07|nr:uncharacterized protein EV422DRAFT_571416 [Fimicolochytrium jonesii]KAI8816888.1 hypothetical protein EV422DRAFT_571416 [Fimicolochytrium jonesii]
MPTVNDGQELLSLFSDIKFTAYLFNAMICGYCMFFVKRNNYLRCALWSSLCGCLGTFLVAVHNGILNRNEMTDARFLALIVAIEIVWWLSELLAAATTYCKIAMMKYSNDHRRRNRWLLFTFGGIFLLARLPVSVSRLLDKTIWDQRIYRAHTLYFIAIVINDTILTTVLLKDSREMTGATEGAGVTCVRSFLRYVFLGSLFRVFYMNIIMLILAITFIPSEATAVNTAIQNFVCIAKYNFGIVFAMDILLTRHSLVKSPEGNAAALPLPQYHISRSREPTSTSPVTEWVTDTRNKHFPPPHAAIIESRPLSSYAESSAESLAAGTSTEDAARQSVSGCV